MYSSVGLCFPELLSWNDTYKHDMALAICCAADRVVAALAELERLHTMGAGAKERTKVAGGVLASPQRCVLRRHPLQTDRLLVRSVPVVFLGSRLLRAAGVLEILVHSLLASWVWLWLTEPAISLSRRAACNNCQVSSLEAHHRSVCRVQQSSARVRYVKFRR